MRNGSRPAAQVQTDSTEGGTLRPFLHRWLTAGMLLVAAAGAVLYISNAIAVNDLLADTTSLERDRDVARNDNEKLRAELLRLMSVERITSIASERLGMMQPAHPPRLLPSLSGRRTLADSLAHR